MRSAKSIGRFIGLIILARTGLAPLAYFKLMPPATNSGFLETAAGSALQIRLAVLLAFVLGVLTITVAIAATPVFRRYSETWGLSFLALSVVSFALLAVENIATLNMVSLSLEYAKASAPHELLQTLGGLARSTWRWAHFTNLMFANVAGVVFCGILYRFALVPRGLAGFALAAGIVSTAAVTAPILGYHFSFLWIMPTALAQLALILWLIVRGFADRPDSGALLRDLASDNSVILESHRTAHA